MDQIVRLFHKVMVPNNDSPEKEFERNVVELFDAGRSEKASNHQLDMRAMLDTLEEARASTRIVGPPSSKGPDSPSKNNNPSLPSNNNNPNSNKPPEENMKPESFAERAERHRKLLDDLQDEDMAMLTTDHVFERKKSSTVGKAEFRLQFYDVPQNIFQLVNRKSFTPPKVLKNCLSADNYVERFQSLLWLEEAHQQVEMRRYDMKNVNLSRYEQNYFLLKVPGLAEGRPSLMRGDKVIIKVHKTKIIFEAYIADVREIDIKIKAHESMELHRQNGLSFDVSFFASRTPFRRCHHGACQPLFDKKLKQLIFPTLPSSGRMRDPMIDIEEEPGKLRCFMRELNIHQKRAVINMVRNIGRPAPYIVFGPPGTGKTVTLVEAILQVYARRKTCKILVCANSNAATDLLASRIKQAKVVQREHLVRVSAFYRLEKDLIPEDLEKITLGMDAIDADAYRRYRIVVTTCIQAGALYEFEERFDYVFIDEAGHANEPETMIALGLLHPRDNKGYIPACVLAGDPHQLGPICISDVAKENGLGQSMIERLFNNPVYSLKQFELETGTIEKIYDENYLTKLIISYRCDKRIMAVNNRMFYENELTFVEKTPKKFLKLLDVKQPLIFHPVKGRDRRIYTNPSWFNAEEAVKVVYYARKLYGGGLKPGQLGIITPYRQQIEKLYDLFELIKLPFCKIATMEEFQGDEREVIIISTVRAEANFLERDRKFKLGFLFDPKRFNVAISRAKWLAIVIGDPDILKTDPCWVQFMATAVRIQDVKQPPTTPKEK